MAAAFAADSGCVSRSSVQHTGRAIESVDSRTQDISFTNLQSVELNFRVDPYIKVAGQLQDIGQQAAVQQLLDLASGATPGVSHFDYEQQISGAIRR